ncbi:MAG: glycosyltransferase family 2 protein [Thermoanaerobaculia bacterium]
MGSVGGKRSRAGSERLSAPRPPLDLAILLVHYRTPELLVGATRALLQDLEAAALRAEIVVIDNGSNVADREAWSGLPLRRIDPGTNLGYAGGVRCGVDATVAPCIVAMNPDVVVETGCLPRLLRELQQGADAAGPQFFWDSQFRLRLPPTELRTAVAELRAAAARRFAGLPWLTGAARRAWRRHARRDWEATLPFASTALSGALLAFRRDAWRNIGPFDEGYRLYFEETDWLLRLQAAGRESRFVPAARAVHLFAQSSVREPASTQWFADAERRFRRRHFGALLGGLLAALSSRSARAQVATRAPGSAWSPKSPPEPMLTADELFGDEAASWVEVALSAAGFPAAAERLDRRGPPSGGWKFPDEIRHRLPPGEIWLRAVTAGGRESSPWRLPPTNAAEPVRP